MAHVTCLFIITTHRFSLAFNPNFTDLLLSHVYPSVQLLTSTPSIASFQNLSLSFHKRFSSCSESTSGKAVRRLLGIFRFRFFDLRKPVAEMASILTSSVPAPLAYDHGLAEAKYIQNSTYPVEEGLENPITISPYVEAPHLLDLRTLEPQAQLLAWALRGLRSVREDYATAPYVDIFNWTEVIATLRQLVVEMGRTWVEQKFYIVVFRSQIPPTTDYAHLGVLDKEASAEAMKSGGFLKSALTSPHNLGTDVNRYWFGSPDRFGRNLATCVWRTRADARLGGVGPAHRRAAGAARHMYTEWSISRLGLLIKNGVEAWEITDWVDDV